MELRDIDQKNLISNSEQTVNTSLEANQYPSDQFQSQDYNPEKPFFENQNNPPSYQPSYQFEKVQNIAEIPHKAIYQPNTNFFSIQAGYSFSSSYILITIFSLVFLFGIIAIILNIMHPIISIIILIFSIYILIFSILPFFSTDNVIQISLEDTYVTIIGKAYCCRKKVRAYSKSQLIRLDLEEEEIGNKIHSKVYRVYLILNEGPKELLFIGNIERYTIEEIRYLLFCVNNHISTKMH